jgi:hypothetical protein
MNENYLYTTKQTKPRDKNASNTLATVHPLMKKKTEFNKILNTHNTFWIRLEGMSVSFLLQWACMSTLSERQLFASVSTCDK